MHQLLSTKTKNQTRWLGLYEMADHSRRLDKHIRKALTGDHNGYCEEELALPAQRVVVSDDDGSDSEGSSGDDQANLNPNPNLTLTLTIRLALRHRP